MVQAFMDIDHGRWTVVYKTLYCIKLNAHEKICPVNLPIVSFS